jgi:hypothetical protein
MKRNYKTESLLSIENLTNAENTRNGSMKNASLEERIFPSFLPRSGKEDLVQNPHLNVSQYHPHVCAAKESRDTGDISGLPRYCHESRQE